MVVVKKTVLKKAVRRKVPSTDSAVDRITGIDFGDEGIKINVYGRSSTGKTTFWATFPKPILCLNASGKGELRSINTPEYRKVIRQVKIQESTDVRDLVAHQRETGHFGTVVLDHATALADTVLKEVLGLDELPAQKSWGMAAQQEYGQAALQMKELMRSILDLPCNVVIVAQERDFNTEESSSEYLMPSVASALTPSVVTWLNSAVDYIVRTYIDEEEITVKGKMKNKKTGEPIMLKKKTGKYQYRMFTGVHPVYMTKFRMPKSKKKPEYIVDPTYDKIMELIEGD